MRHNTNINHARQLVEIDKDKLNAALRRASALDANGTEARAFTLAADEHGTVKLKSNQPDTLGLAVEAEVVGDVIDGNHTFTTSFMVGRRRFRVIVMSDVTA
jgi:hypothetical protein